MSLNCHVKTYDVACSVLNVLMVKHVHSVGLTDVDITLIIHRHVSDVIFLIFLICMNLEHNLH